MATVLEAAKTSEAVLAKFPAGGPLLPEQEAARKIQAEAAKKGALSAIDSMRKQPPVREKEFQDIIDKNIGIDMKIDPATGRKDRTTLSTEEIARLDRAENGAKLARNLIENGFSGLTAPEQAAIKSQVEQAINQWPDGRALFSAATNKDEIIQQLLEDPLMLPKVDQLLRDSVTPDKILSPDTLKQLTEKAVLLKRARDAKKAELKTAKDRLRDAKSELRKYEPGGAYAADMSESETALDSEITIKQRAINTRTRLIEEIEFELERRLAGHPPTDARTDIQLNAAVAAYRTDIVNRQTEIANAQKKRDRKIELVRKQNELNANKPNLEDRIVELDDQLKEAEYKYTRANVDLESAKYERSSDEEAFAKGMEDLVSKAVFERIQDKITAVDQARQELIEKELKGTLTEGENKLLTALNKRYVDFKVEEVRTMRNMWRKRLETTRILKKDQIKSDFELAIREDDGRAALVKKMLQDQRMPDSQIDEYLANKDFMDKMGNRVMTELLEKRLETGELTDAERQKLQQSEWGKDVVSKAIEANEHRIKDMEKKGEVAPGFWEKIKNMDFAKASGELVKFLLYVLFGATIGAIFGPGGVYVGGAIGGVHALTKMGGGHGESHEKGHGGAPVHKPSEPKH